MKNADTMTFAGARALRDAILNYWGTERRQDRFFLPSVRIEPSASSNRHGGTAYIVRSDMINGLPRKRNV